MGERMNAFELMRSLTKGISDNSDTPAPLTYTRRMAIAGYKRVALWSHKDDEEILRKYAIELATKRRDRDPI
jgi:hypothetical protein